MEVNVSKFSYVPSLLRICPHSHLSATIAQINYQTIPQVKHNGKKNRQLKSVILLKDNNLYLYLKYSDQLLFLHLFSINIIDVIPHQ